MVVVDGEIAVAEANPSPVAQAVANGAEEVPLQIGADAEAPNRARYLEVPILTEGNSEAGAHDRVKPVFRVAYGAPVGWAGERQLAVDGPVARASEKV